MLSVQTVIDRLAPIPEIDHAEFGEIEVQKLSRIQALTGAFLGRNWISIPHVTHHDEVDVTDMEDRRGAWNADNSDAKVTPVVLLARALAAVLADFPRFNASLTPDGGSLVLKKYFHISIAVDTPNGLLVPVLRDVDTLGLADIATQLAAISHKARTKGLSLAEMSGSSMCISSLGHIGGVGFTPIINAPDVAILGATAIQLRPAPGPDGGILWRKMLPLSLSYDHRVINGAAAALFTQAIGARLASEALFA